jgi:uncharacterized OB-fold protein
VSAEKPLPRVNETTRPYWDAAREGRLLLQRCRACATWIHYPRAWCPACWSTNLEWSEASGRGHVVTYSVVHQAPFESYAAAAPYVLAVIRLEEGPQMMANVLDVDPKDVAIDMAVEVTFEKRQRGFAVPQFRPPARGR